MNNYKHVQDIVSSTREISEEEIELKFKEDKLNFEYDSIRVQLGQAAAKALKKPTPKNLAEVGKYEVELAKNNLERVKIFKRLIELGALCYHEENLDYWQEEAADIKGGN